MKLLLLLANGFEEIEALGTLDLLRRGEVEVTTCTLNQTPLTLGAHNIAVEAELCLTELDSTQYDGVILPGGMGGSQALAATQGVLELLKDYNEQGKTICAICAAPALVLTAADIIQNRKVTCYPAPEFIEALGDNYLSAKAHTEGNLITAAGPGCFTDFAKAIMDAVAPGTSEGVFKAALIKD
ncbi:MAG: DJ-1/PfpI family protein [Kiritimatiellae bacterium]|nr:DJ-1/PfpI family protein [Kiritimatiellia bacterium]